MRLLVDSDFLVALAKTDDSNHIKAVSKAEIFEAATIFVTPFTVPEATTVISYKMSQGSARTFLEESRRQNWLELPIDETIVKRADQLFLNQTKKGTSWIDCLNVAMIKEFRIDGILSFDKFYKNAGITLY